MKKAALIVMAVAILTLPLITLSDALAGRGPQQDATPRYGQDHPRAEGNLSEKDMEKLEAERAAFFKETKELRFRIEDKAWELGRELRMDKPDEKKAMALQKELSDLRGQLDQKFLAHRLKMRALFPEAEFFGPGGGRGFGPCAYGDPDGDGDREGGRGYGRGMMYGGGRGGCGGGW